MLGDGWVGRAEVEGGEGVCRIPGVLLLKCKDMEPAA